MKPQQLIMLVIALACGIAAMVMTQQYLAKDTAAPTNTVAVVVPVKDINQGVKITKEMLTVVQMDPAILPADYMTDLAKVEGQTSKYPLRPKEVITKNDLSSWDGILSKLTPGNVAKTVNITEAVGGFIAPDNYVDVNLTTTGTADDPPRVTTILRRIRLLAVNENMQHDVAGGTKGQKVNNVTFEVTPRDAMLLDLAKIEGSLTLSLVGAETTEDAGPVTPDDLYGRKEEPPPPEPVVVESPKTKPAKLVTYRDRDNQKIHEVYMAADFPLGKLVEVPIDMPLDDPRKSKGPTPQIAN